MNFEDPRIRQLSCLALCVMALGMLVAASFCAAIAVEYLVLNQSRGNDSDGLAKLMIYLPKVENAKLAEFTSIVGTIVAAVPLMVAPVCLRAVEVKGESQRRLTKFGVGLMYVLVLILLVAILAYLSIDPQGWTAAQAHSLDLAQLTTLQDMAHDIIRGSVFFLAALWGLKAVR